jgi:tRNA G18 (ribose-2'-O)-methylase SpoU
MTNTALSIKAKRDAELAAASSPYNVHDHLKHLSIAELKSVSAQDRLPWHTLCLNVTGDLNVGTMIRTSHCLGASSVIIFGRQRIDQRSLVGSSNYITVDRVSAVDANYGLKAQDLHDYLHKKNLTPIFVETGGIKLPQIDWKMRIGEMSRRSSEPCLIMGNETGGTPQDILDLRDVFANSFIVSIPQRGVIRSFNVASAHAMIALSMCAAMDWC